MANKLDKVVAERTERRQHELADQVRRSVTHIDRVVLRVWNDTLALLGKMKDKDHPQTYKKILDQLRKVLPTVAKATEDAITGVAKWSHASTVKILMKEVPTEWWSPVVLKPAMQYQEASIEIGAPTEKDMSEEEIRKLLFPTPPKSEIEKIIYATNVQGKTWEERLAGLSKRITNPEQMADRLATGISQGKNIKQLAKDLQPYVGNIRSSAKRIARTEMRRVSNDLQDQAWEQAGDLIQGFQLLATLDEVTRETHKSRNGTIYWKHKEPNVAKRPRVPDEPNCRCWYTPVFKPMEEIDDQISGASPEFGVKDPIIYNDWFGRQSIATQKSIVGAQRWHTVAKKWGDLSPPQWADFVDPNTGKLHPLAKLKKMDTGLLSANRVNVLNTSPRITPGIKTQIIPAAKIPITIPKPVLDHWQSIPELKDIITFCQSPCPLVKAVTGIGVEILEHKSMDVKTGKSKVTYQIYKDGKRMSIPGKAKSHFLKASKANQFAQEILAGDTKPKEVPFAGLKPTTPAVKLKVHEPIEPEPKPFIAPKVIPPTTSPSYAPTPVATSAAAQKNVEVQTVTVKGKEKYRVFVNGVVQVPEGKSVSHFSNKNVANKFAASLKTDPSEISAKPTEKSPVETYKSNLQKHIQKYEDMIKSGKEPAWYHVKEYEFAKGDLELVNTIGVIPDHPKYPTYLPKDYKPEVKKKGKKQPVSVAASIKKTQHVVSPESSLFDPNGVESKGGRGGKKFKPVEEQMKTPRAAEETLEDLGYQRHKTFKNPSVARETRDPTTEVDPAVRYKRLLQTWEGSSRQFNSIEMAEACKKQFGLSTETFNPGKHKVPESYLAVTQKDVADIHAATQAWFKANGIKTVKLYRGVNSSKAAVGTIESWSSSKARAKDFGSLVLEKEIPVENILIHYQLAQGMKKGNQDVFGVGDEREFIVMNP